MIYTLTPNPAIDMNVTCDALAPNRVTRTKDAVYTPNGKGLNVSFTLERFGVPAPILGFFGGFSGTYVVEGARARGSVVHPVYVSGITRINVFIATGEGEYTLPNEGCPVPREAQLEMLQMIDALPDLDCLVVSGSLSPAIEPTYYDELAEHLERRGAELVLDTSHPHLRNLLARRPLLIKPNEDEVASIFGLAVASDEEALSALRMLRSAGSRNVLLTMGERGAYFAGEDGSAWHASAPAVTLLSTACAGDAALGAFLSVWYPDRTAVERALRRAMATGANVATSAGLGDFAQVGELGRQVIVRQIG